MGKALEKTKKYMKETKERRNAELQDLDEVIRNLEEKKKEAILHEDLATTSCNVQEYKAAKGEQAEINVQIEMYKKRKTALRSGQLITAEDYEAHVSEVRKELQKAGASYAEQLYKHYKGIADIGRDFWALINDADKTLQELQRVFYKNADRGNVDERTGKYQRNAVSAARYAEQNLAMEAMHNYTSTPEETYAYKYMTGRFGNERPSPKTYVGE